MLVRAIPCFFVEPDKLDIETHGKPIYSNYQVTILEFEPMHLMNRTRISTVVDVELWPFVLYIDVIWTRITVRHSDCVSKQTGRELGTALNVL